MSVTSRCSIEMAGQIEHWLLWHRVYPSLMPTLCCKGLQVSSKIRVLPSRISSQTLNLAILMLFFHSTSTIASVVNLDGPLPAYRTEHLPSFTTLWAWCIASCSLSATAETCLTNLLFCSYSSMYGWVLKISGDNCSKFFAGQMPIPLPNRRCQSTEGKSGNSNH